MEGNANKILAPSEEAVIQAVQSHFAGDVDLQSQKARRISFKAKRERLFELCTMLKDELNFAHCSMVSGIDWVEHMQTVHHISNYETGVLVEILVDIPNDDLVVDSVTPLWEGANWHERETFELFGIDFKGHPRMEQLLLADDYKFFPFRKSFKVGRQI